MTKESFIDRVTRHSKEYHTVSSGLSGECDECRRDFDMQVTQEDVVIKSDGMYLKGQCILSRETLLEDAVRECDEVDDEEYFFELRYLDIPEELLNEVFNEKVSDQTYLDEGNFSWSQCDTCGTTMGGTRYNAHGLTEDMSIHHLNICEDCALFFANGDIPQGEE